MKNPARHHCWSFVRFRLGCLLFFLAFVTTSVEASPVGYWDCVLSGGERGVAHVFFYANGSLNGQVVWAPGKRTSTTTNVIGSAALEGRWSYATPKGTNQLLGFINAIASPAGTSTLKTNGFSFRGAVRAGKLTLVALGEPGQVLFSGIPLDRTNDLTGTYYATGKKPGVAGNFVEVFDVTPVPELAIVTNSVTTAIDCGVTNVTIYADTYSTTNSGVITYVTNYVISTLITQQVCLVTNTVVRSIFNEYPANYYDAVGGGPGYDYRGALLVSRQKYAAFIQTRGPMHEFITAYAGPFNPATGRGSLVGGDREIGNTKLTIAPRPPSPPP
jgi:hypothetical protein